MNFKDSTIKLSLNWIYQEFLSFLYILIIVVVFSSAQLMLSGNSIGAEHQRLLSRSNHQLSKKDLLLIVSDNEGNSLASTKYIPQAITQNTHYANFFPPNNQQTTFPL